jgi:hypothetical protein
MPSKLELLKHTPVVGPGYLYTLKQLLELRYMVVKLNLLGVEYKAAIPARKSLARSLPPVADAAYGP